MTKKTDIETTIDSQLSTSTTVPQSIWDALRQPTPKKFIKKREGASGRSFDYVEAGYVKDLLNKTFNTWSFTVVDKQVGNSQIWVQGRLTVQIPVPQKDGTITFVEIIKEQFGGTSIKKARSTGLPVDIGNDLKAAASDALKKCASEWGIASDIYWGEVDNDDEEPIQESATTKAQANLDATKPAPLEDRPTPKQINYMNVLINEKGIARTTAHSWFNVKSLNDLTYDQGQQVIKKLLDITTGGYDEETPPDPTDLF